jgi:hypothetical protein
VSGWRNAPQSEMADTARRRDNRIGRELAAAAFGNVLPSSCFRVGNDDSCWLQATDADESSAAVTRNGALAGSVSLAEDEEASLAVEAATRHVRTNQRNLDDACHIVLIVVWRGIDANSAHAPSEWVVARPYRVERSFFIPGGPAGNPAVRGCSGEFPFSTRASSTARCPF